MTLIQSFLSLIVTIIGCGVLLRYPRVAGVVPLSLGPTCWKVSIVRVLHTIFLGSRPERPSKNFHRATYSIPRTVLCHVCAAQSRF